MTFLLIVAIFCVALRVNAVFNDVPYESRARVVLAAYIATCFMPPLAWQRVVLGVVRLVVYVVCRCATDMPARAVLRSLLWSVVTDIWLR